jgi:peptidoglycan/xylan/chitin deacetylase (PgdA/CDA1 family)
MFIKRGILMLIWLIGFSLPLAGCYASTNVNLQTVVPQLSPTATFTTTISPTAFLAITNTPIIIPPSYTPTSTFTPSPTSTPVPTDTPVPTNTPVPTETTAMIWNPPGHVIAPILLYHHVSDAGNGNRYYVTTDTFRAQMQTLHDWGYTSITVSDLVDVLITGGELPYRPIVITFDDGNVDIYQNAFPIMHEMGFVGTTYIVANRLQSKYYVNVEQLQEMAGDGWEIGSHAMSHTDLTTDYSIARYEILQSRLTLEDATGKPVNTFAYPYGKTDEFVTNKVSEYGYRAGMGLGSSYEHTLSTLFYLSRIEVQGEYSITKFASLLAWSN